MSSSARWAELRERIQPDQTSEAICDIFASTPFFDGRDGFTWRCADGSFTGVFTPDGAGAPRLLYGRFSPTSPPPAPAQRPSNDDLVLMRQLQQHWHAPLVDLEGTLKRLEELAKTYGDDSDREHSQRLMATARVAAAWVAAGRPEPMPIIMTMEKPGDLDVAWMGLAITGDPRCLRHVVAAATSGPRSVQFVARWSLDANIRQDPQVDALMIATTWSPAEQALVDRLLQRSGPPGAVRAVPTP